MTTPANLSLPKEVPTAPTAAIHAVETQPVVVDDPKSWRILVVDDEQDNRTLASLSLQYYGANVAVAVNGPQALELAITFAPNLILMDLQMPTMDGYMTLRALRSNPLTAAIPVVALTANVMPQDRIRVDEAGFDSFIGKPFEVMKLPNMIQEILSKKA